MAKILTKVMDKHKVLIVKIAPGELLSMAVEPSGLHNSITKAIIGAVWKWLQVKGTEFLNGMKIGFADVSFIDDHYEVSFYPLAWSEKLKVKDPDELPK